MIFLIVIACVLILLLVIVACLKSSKKKKKKLQNHKKRNEIRYAEVENSRKHPHWVFESYKKGNTEMLKSVNITHKIPKGKTGLKLKENPDRRKTYVVMDVQDRPESEYEPKRNDYRLGFWDEKKLRRKVKKIK